MEKLIPQEQDGKNIQLADGTLIDVDEIVFISDIESSELSPYQAHPYGSVGNKEVL